jgi:copper chaperone CopZ
MQFMKRTLAASVVAIGFAAMLEACAGRPGGNVGDVPEKRECEVALALPNMVCEEGCPVRVRAALAGVSGVRDVSVDFESKNALVDAQYPACSRAGVEDMIGKLFAKGYRAEYVGMRAIPRMQ